MKKLLIFILLVPFVSKSQPLPNWRTDSVIVQSGASVIRYTQTNWYAAGATGDSLRVRKNDGTIGLMSEYDLPVSFAVAAAYNDKTQDDARFVQLGGSYSNPAWITSLDYSKITNIPAASITVDTISTARAFNTAYQMSTTKNVLVSISASASPTLSLSGGQAGEVYLEISANGSTNWLSYGKIAIGNTGTLTIGLNTTGLGGAGLSAIVPAGYFWRARTNNLTGTPTYVFNGGGKATFN